MARRGHQLFGNSELFIPVPDLHYFQTGFQTGKDTRGACHDISADKAVEAFHELADLRTLEKPELPFTLAGQSRTGPAVDRKKKDVRSLRLKHGDLVHFRLKSDANGPTLDSLAVSAIWREDVGDNHGFFPEELRPFNDARKTVTAAELLFGFVPEASQDQAAAGEASPVEPQQPQASPAGLRGMAGRLRFSNGRMYEATPDGEAAEGDGLYLGWTPLKILGSPKPPCPPMYFQPRKQGSDYVAKKDLHPEAHKPRGRKFYLHHQTWDGQGKPPWESHQPNERKNLKLLARPIPQQKVFWFHIDFDNLSRSELALLCYALQPCDGFHHKLGLGKPLGLGSVLVETAGIFYLDRKARYKPTDLFSVPRYAARRLANGVGAGDFPPRYTAEASGGISDGGPQPETLRAGCQPPGGIQQALEVLGKISSTSDAPMHYPVVDGTEDLETEHFHWFVANDGNRSGMGHQSLKTVSGMIPSLRRQPRKD